MHKEPHASVSRFRRRTVFVAIALLPVIAGAQTVSITTALGVQTRQTLSDSLPTHVLNASMVARAASSEVVQVTLSLQPRDPAGLQAFADAVSDPSSPLYRHYLTAAQVGDRFGASAESRQAVADYLEKYGLNMILVAPNGMAVTAQGTSANVENAFKTKIAYFKGTDATTSKTITYRANTTVLTVPFEVSDMVINVSGIDTSNRPKPRVTLLTPSQTSVLYDTTPLKSSGYTGTGRKIAISSFDGFKLSNAKSFITKYALPTPSAGATSNISVATVGTGAMNTSASGEGDLDIQMVIGQAPLASIRVYDSTSDLIGVLSKESSDNWADVVTESYGWSLSTSSATSAHNIHLAMTSQGITYMAASGDNGTSIGSYSYPDYDPEVLQVGGTIATVGTTGTRTSEVGWSLYRGYGSGGGWVNNASSFNTLPSWQKGTGVPTTVNRRLIPDVALHASGPSNSGAYYFYSGGTLQSAIGTSFASPVFAGCLATVEQRKFGSTASTGANQRLGRIQNRIYALNGSGTVFYDIKSGTNGKLPASSTSTTSNTLGSVTSSCTTGWDYVTGWGAMDFNAFYKTL